MLKIFLFVIFSFNIWLPMWAGESKQYGQMAFIKTHNATSTTQKKLLGLIGNPVANQHKNVGQQLADGIRTFKVPVHLVNGQPWITHTLPRQELDDYLKHCLKPIRDLVAKYLWKIDAANESVPTFLGTIKSFLDKNPSQVVTLFFNIFVPADQHYKLVDMIKKSGLQNDMHIQPWWLAWPTLQDMVQNNKRLVIFFDEAIPDGNLSGFHYTKHYIVENNYDFKTVKALQDDLMPGSKSVDALKEAQKVNTNQAVLFELNHFVTPGISGDDEDAKKVNAYAVLKAHIDRFHAATGKYPNFIHVDFYDENFEDIKKTVREISD